MQRHNTQANLPVRKLSLSPDDVYHKSSSENIISLLICRICFEILVSPVQCYKCNQCFCQSCIQLNQNKCPTRCQNPNFKKNIFVNNVISTLKFKCKNGCGKIIDYDELEKHYDEDCAKNDFRKKYLKLKGMIEKNNKNKIA